jgi:hypothetical protein
MRGTAAAGRVGFFMFANLFQVIRGAIRSRVFLAVAVFAATLTVVASWGPLTGFVRNGHVGSGSLTSLVSPGSNGTSPAANSAASGSTGSSGNQSTGSGAGSPGPTSTGSGPNVQSGTLNPTVTVDPHKKTICPSGGLPAPGSTVTGGLVVDGNCVLTNVIINGGVEILGTGHLTLYASTVNGNTDVQPNGEFDSNFPEKGQPNQLNGGVSATTASNEDIHGGIVRGRVLYTGITPPPPNVYVILSLCGVNIQGDLTVANILPGALAGKGFPNGAQLGDPGENDLTNPCLGNTITGSVFIRDDVGGRIELENNTIGGSVQIFNSDPSVTGNTIGGGLLCHQGSKFHVWDTDDSNTDSVHGPMSCA